MNKKSILLYLSLILLLQNPLFSQEENNTEPIPSPPNPVDFGFGLGIGAVNLEGDTYTSIRLNPDLAIGNFGIGLDINFRFTMSGENGDTSFSVYEPDWYLPDGDFSDYLNLYLSKFDYIRWGHSGDDLYALLGSINSATVGNGFIVGGYTNGNFKPAKKYTGFRFEMDTALFNWPYMGVELMISNLSELDLMATRIYAKPLGGIESPVISGLELGITFAVDRNPYFFLKDEDSNGTYDLADAGAAFVDYKNTLFLTTITPEPVYVYGVDFMQPLLDIKVFSLALYGDYVLQGLSKPAMGGTTGLNGTLIKYITWDMGLIFRGDDFVPSYFDRTYDLDRSTKYILYQNDHSKPIQPSGTDYKALLGFNFLNQKISFLTQITGPFDKPTGNALDAPWEYPHLMALFTIAEDLIPYFDMSFWYDKQGIDNFKALADPTNALIGGRINYRNQGAVLSMQIDVKYDAGLPDNWIITTKLEAGFQF